MKDKTMNEIHRMFQQMTLDEVRAMAAAGATELAQRWLPSVPGAHDHIAAGAGLIMEIELRPKLAITMLLVNSNSERIQLATREFPMPTEH
jgi:hypothetical protein